MAGGKRPGAGRKKGTPNKITGELKGMILQALSDAGGIDYLAKQAEQSPSAFLSLIGKVLPMTIEGNPDKPLETVVKLTIIDARNKP
jgi:hypothetical protein